MITNRSKKFYFILIIFVFLFSFGATLASTVLGGDNSQGGQRCDSSGVKDCRFSIFLSDPSYQAYSASVTTTIDNWRDTDDSTLSIDSCLVMANGVNYACSTFVQGKIWPSEGCPGFANALNNDNGDDGCTTFGGAVSVDQNSPTPATWATFHLRVDSIYTHSTFSISGRKDVPDNPTCVSTTGNACSSSGNSCGQTNSGTVQCDGSCSALTPADSSCVSSNQYRCSGASTCIFVGNDGTGDTSDPNCNNSCADAYSYQTPNAYTYQTPGTGTYRCSGAGSCIFVGDDGTGDTNDPTCGNICVPPYSYQTPAGYSYQTPVVYSYQTPYPYPYPYPTPTYPVTVNKASGGAAISTDNLINCGSTCVHNYDENSTVTIQAKPSSGYWKFTGWSGDCSGAGDCVLNVTGPRTVTPSFILRIFDYKEF